MILLLYQCGLFIHTCVSKKSIVSKDLILFQEVQMFFLTTSRNICAGKFVKSERLLAVLFLMSSELRFVKRVRFFEQNCIVR